MFDDMENQAAEGFEFNADDARRISEILEMAAAEETLGKHLHALAGLAAVGNYLDATRTALVAAARAENHSWAEIGEALGTSKQTAFNRYGDK